MANSLERTNPTVGQHVYLQIAPVLKQLLAPGTTNHCRVAAVHLLRVPLKCRTRAQQFGAQLALEVS